jgi:hypothetical protein
LNLPVFYPGINVFPTSVEFTNAVVGTGAKKTVTVQNSGNADLVIGTITSPSAPFQIVENHCSGETLSFGASCALTILFSPTSAGTFTSSFDIPSNDSQKNPVVIHLSGVGINEIILSSPQDQVPFDACSYYAPPTLQWNTQESVSSYSLQFSEDPAFSFIRVKARVSGKKTEKRLSSHQWKRVLLIPGSSGGMVYWRVVGTRSDGTSAISDTRSIMVSTPQPVGNPALSPTSIMGLPILSWQNNCSIKFQVWFGNSAGFSNRKILSFRLSNPDLDGGNFLRGLTLDQWMAIRGLVNDVAGSTIYWYVESQDPLRRTALTELMQVTLEE